MKKRFLFAAAASVCLSMSAQVAVLEDVTPSGYNFDKYEDGTELILHGNGSGGGWSPAAIYNSDAFYQDGHFTAIVSRGRDGENTAAKVAQYQKGVTIRDFGGALGKCLVINEEGSAFNTATPATQKYFGEGKEPWTGIEGSTTGSFSFGFYDDSQKIQHNWAGHAIRIRLVFNIVRPSAKAKKQKLDQGMIDGFCMYEAPGAAWYTPSDEYDSSRGSIAEKYAVTAIGSEFGKWENEGTSVDEIPANPVLLKGQGADPFDETGDENPDYYCQLNRFMVYEWDVYTTNVNQSIKAIFDFWNSENTIIIKEIKFFNITNSMDLLEVDGTGKVTAYKEGSYFFKRVKSWRYYVESEPEAPALGTESNPYLINNKEDLCSMYQKMVPGQTTYFKQTADIDMSGVTDWIVPNGYNGTYNRAINYDGGNHIISNFAPVYRDANDDNANGYYSTTLFGVLTGSVKNLGVVNATCNAMQLEGGILGGFVGGPWVAGVETKLDNVFVTGKVKYDGGLAGGLYGCSAGTVNITNSYAQVDVDAATAAGVCPSSNTLNISNSYVYATVKGSTAAYLFTNGGTVNAKNVWAIGGDDAPAGVDAYETFDPEIIEDIQTWDAFNAKNMFNGIPALNWQTTSTPPSSGIDNVEINENAPVEYFNLQGVKVENPTQGLYIKRQGSKATKVVIR